MIKILLFIMSLLTITIGATEQLEIKIWLLDRIIVFNQSMLLVNKFYFDQMKKDSLSLQRPIRKNTQKKFESIIQDQHHELEKQKKHYTELLAEYIRKQLPAHPSC